MKLFSVDATLHRSAFCEFPFQWIYYCHSSKSTEKEIGKTHLCVLFGKKNHVSKRPTVYKTGAKTTQVAASFII